MYESCFLNKAVASADVILAKEILEHKHPRQIHPIQRAESDSRNGHDFFCIGPQYDLCLVQKGYIDGDKYQRKG